MHLTLHLTRSCNMRCDYCYAPPRADEGMSEAIGAQALELGARLTGADGSCGIVFFGGEPLLHKELIAALIARARRMEAAGAGRFHFKCTTNGVLLDGEFLDFALAADLLVAMSFDGVREAHDRHRRFPDGGPTYDVLLERLKLLLAVRPYASVLMVVNPDTAQFLPASCELLLDLGARYLIISPNYAGDWRKEDYHALEKAYRRLGKLYVKWTRARRKFYLSPFEVKLSSHINCDTYHKERCELARRQLSVDPEGRLYPCVQFTRGPASEWCIGTVAGGIDETARQRIHDASQAEKDHCRDCAVKARCNNTCGCLNWQTTGSLNEISPVLCRHEQMLMPIADRVGGILYKKRDPLFLHKHYNAAYPVLSLIEDVLGDDDTAK